MTAASTDAGWSAEARERQAANLLGALALTLADRLEHAVTAAARLSSSDAAALALHHFLDSPNVDLLARVLGLSSPGAVRLLDRSSARALHAASPAPTGASRRSRDCHRPPAGAGGYRARSSSTSGPWKHSSAEQRQLRAGEQDLAGLIRPPGATRWTRRLCDLDACGRPQGHCPVYEAAKARYGGAEAG